MSVHRDFWVGVGSVAVGGIVLYESLSMQYPTKVFPLGISVVTITLGVAIAAMALLRRNEPHAVPFFPSLLTMEVIAAAIAYVALIDILGFFSSSFLCIMVISELTSHKKPTIRSLAMTALCSAVFLAIVYILFIVVLKFKIPHGVLL